MTDDVEVVVAHAERTTVRVGDVFVKIDGDAERLAREARSMAAAPVPTAHVLWQQEHVLALAALPGTALGRLGAPSTASSAAWTAAGAMVRRLHGTSPPPWPGRVPERHRDELAEACAWIVANDVLPEEVVERNRQVAAAAFRPFEPAFTHGDLQLDHVFVSDDEVVGVLDWSEAGLGDPVFDLAVLTLGHEERLGEVLAGYGADVDVAAVHGWWSLRCLTSMRWLIEHGFDPARPGAEVDVLLARM